MLTHKIAATPWCPTALMAAVPRTAAVPVVAARRTPSPRNDAGSAGADPLAPPAIVGNPISLFTGNKREVETDFSLPGAALAFRRFYNSANEAWRSGVGQGWSHTYAVTLFATPDGARELLQSDGRRLHFAPAGTDEEGRTIFRTGSAFEGTIVATAENAHRWELPDGRHLAFNGSYLIEIDWPDQRHLSLYYRQQRLVSVTDETGRVLRLAWWPGITGADRALGGYKAQAFGPASGQLASLTLPDGEVIGYEYDRRSNLTRTTYPDGTHREYHYEDETYPRHLTGLTDRTGVRFASWTYDSEGRAISSEHAGGVERVTMEHPDASAIEVGQRVGTSVTNSLGQPSLYAWEKPVGGAPRLLEATGAGCASCPPTGMRWEYDEQGRLAEAVVTGKGTARGAGTMQYAHDEQGRLVGVQRIGSDGTVVPVERREYAHAQDPAPVRIARPSVNPDQERVTTVERDDRGRVTAVIERGYRPVFTASVATDTSDASIPSAYAPIERTTSLIWKDDDLVGIDGPRTDVQDITRLEWDASHRLTAILPPASPAIRVRRHDAMGRVTAYQLGSRTPIELTYDASGRIIRSHQGGRSLRLSHDAENRLQGLTDENGSSVTVQHDDAGRLWAITDEAGRTNRVVHDTENRVIGRALAGVDGATMRLVEHLFDERGTLTRTIDERLGGSAPSTQVLDYQQAANGDELIVSEMSTGARATRVFDPVARLSTLVDPGGARTRVGFDPQGGIVQVRDARGNVTLSPTDDFGRTVMQHGPDTGRVINRFDAAGNRVEQRLADGTIITAAYDAANRRVSRRAGGRLATWRWDQRSGLMVEAANGTMSERFEYDAEARLTSHVRSIDGHQLRTGYTHDVRGRLRTKTLPDGQQLAYHYHEAGADRGTLRAITRSSLRTLFVRRTLVAEIDLERRDGEAGYLSANGIRTQETYAPNGELSRLEIGGALAFGYTFDAAGRIVRIEQVDRTGIDDTRYAYRHGRLVDAASTRLGAERWRYDAVGNRLAQETRSAAGRLERASYRYPEPGDGNRLGAVDSEWTLPSGRTLTETVDYDYTPSGAPTQVGGLDYRYDAMQRPVSVSRDGVLLAEYAYNAFGERIRKTRHRPGANPEVSYYLYDGSTLTGEARADGTIERQYVYLQGHRPVAMLEGHRAYAIHTDHVGAPRLMTDSAGDRVWQADYFSFGEAVIDPDSVVSLNLRFPGQYADAETGTHYNYFRDYDPESGRYLTSDPLGLVAGLNTYAYVDGNPLSQVDPEGLLAALAPAAGGAFWTWVTVSGPPGWLVGGVVAVGVAAYWYANHNEGGEEGFSAQVGNAKPTVDDFTALHFDLERYDSVLAGQVDINAWDGSWGRLFALQNQLLGAQRAYVDRTDAFLAEHDGQICLLPADQALYNEAVDALGEAREAEEAEDAVPQTASPEPPPECEEATKGIKQRLYRNKHNTNPEKGSNVHGYLPRMLEQICGRLRPGSTGWTGHKIQLEDILKGITNRQLTLNRNNCPEGDHLSRQERDLIGEFRRKDSRWSPANMPHLGPEHPLCDEYETVRDSGSIDAVIRLLGRMTN